MPVSYDLGLGLALAVPVQPGLDAVPGNSSGFNWHGMNRPGFRGGCLV